MVKKVITFSIGHLLIENTPFDLNDFSVINNQDFQQTEIKHDKKKVETLSVKKIEKDIKGSRFISLYFNGGDKYPYPAKVIKNMQELDNPRSAEEIELSDHFFVLIDVSTQRVFMSDLRKRNEFSHWLQEKISKRVVIKSILNEEDFLKNIQSIDEISFSVIPDLFNLQNEDFLSNHLAQDINGFGADYATIKFKYKKKKLSDLVLGKVQALLGVREKFKNIEIIGRDEEGFESVFNLDEVINKTSIEYIYGDSKSLDASTVFDLLIAEIKEHEKNS